jgi:hypothetical protein
VLTSAQCVCWRVSVLRGAVLCCLVGTSLHRISICMGTQCLMHGECTLARAAKQQSRKQLASPASAQWLHPSMCLTLECAVTTLNALLGLSCALLQAHSGPRAPPPSPHAPPWTHPLLLVVVLVVLVLVLVVLVLVLVVLVVLVPWLAQVMVVHQDHCHRCCQRCLLAPQPAGPADAAAAASHTRLPDVHVAAGAAPARLQPQRSRRQHEPWRQGVTARCKRAGGVC